MKFQTVFYQEVNLFLRGVIPSMGFKTTTVEYEVLERFAGTSKYNFLKMMTLAMNGITSFSVQPMRMVSMVGFGVFIISLFMIAYNIATFFMGRSISGWASIVCSVWFLGGAILLSIGVTGEYTGRIYSEVKQRPRYIIDKKIID